MDVLRCSIGLLSVLLLHGPAETDQRAINGTNQTDILMGGPTMSSTPGTYLPVVLVTLPASTVAEDTPRPPPASQDNVVTTSPTSTLSVKGAGPFTESSSVPQPHQSSPSPGSTDNMTSMSPSSMPLTATSSPRVERHATSSQASAALPAGSAAATTAHSDPSNTSPKRPPDTQMDLPPTQPPDNSLTMVAFGVMSFILILIIVMVILVTVVNLKGRWRTPEAQGKKSNDSMVSESNMTTNAEKESITLVSIKTINTETDTDSPQASSAHSTTLDIDNQEFRQDLLNNKLV